VTRYDLVSDPPLAGVDVTHGTVSLRAPAGWALVSFAIPLGQDEAARSAITKAYGLDLPDVGRSGLASDGTTRIITLGTDRGMILLDHAAPRADRTVAAGLGGALYLTDQTDGWAVLQIDGPDARTALARICPLDLHHGAFPENAAAQTVMEHLGVLILRTGADTFLLMSASSSALSFLHAVETSIGNVA